jgi:hypothetical protein
LKFFDDKSLVIFIPFGIMWIEYLILSTRGFWMHLAYDLKNGIMYAKLCVSTRDGRDVLKDFTNLGRVLDKERGIYKNRERGVFVYDLPTNTYGKAPEDFSPPSTSRKESLILDFVDVFFLDHFVGVKGCVKQ